MTWTPDYGLRRLRAAAHDLGYVILKDRNNKSYFMVTSKEDGNTLLRTKNIKEIQALVKELQALT